jgi:predicted component of type VI protein secretion system
MKAELIPENGDPPIPITKDLTVIGRREYCDITIHHHSLSKRHCVVVKTDGLLIIRDLATTNGTKVKGQKIRWAALLPDDRITFGSYKLRVYLGPDNVPGPSEAGQIRSGVVPVPAARNTTAVAAASPILGPQGFAPPSGPEVPLAPPLDDLEIIEEDTDDSGWRKLIASRRSDDDLIIDLE